MASNKFCGDYYLPLYLISLRLIFLPLITKLNYFEAHFKDIILRFYYFFLSILHAY